MFSFGGPQFGLREGKLARWLPGGGFGANVNIPSIQVLSYEAVVTNQDLKGNDKLTATASRIEAANVTFRFGSISLEVLEAITGNAMQSSGSGASAYRFVPLTNRRLPYFGVSGKAASEETEGETHMFAPKCKVVGNFTLRFEQDNFSIPELSCRAIADDNYKDADGNDWVFAPIEYASAKAVSLPPHGF
jgi:hypothetical protein